MNQLGKAFDDGRCVNVRPFGRLRKAKLTDIGDVRVWTLGERGQRAVEAVLFNLNQLVITSSALLDSKEASCKLKSEGHQHQSFVAPLESPTLNPPFVLKVL